MNLEKHSYASAMLSGFDYLLDTYPEVFIIGQGLWSPWYVGNTMTDLDKKFGTKRIIDTPVSESATTGAGVGASLVGMKPIVVHPRMDFMLYAMDSIINEASKWSYMFGGQANAGVTIRGIINRGGEQGAQHSQSLHSLFAHIPGLRVVMPSSVSDARDLLISSVLCKDPVLYIDDRWLYDFEDYIEPIKELSLKDQKPKVLKEGNDISIIASSYSSRLCLNAAIKLDKKGINCEVVDLRVINPLHTETIISSVKKTGRLLTVDGSWKNCGLAGEIIASVVEQIPINCLKTSPKRLTLPSAPAPTSRLLEKAYYFDDKAICEHVVSLLKNK